MSKQDTEIEWLKAQCELRGAVGAAAAGLAARPGGKHAPQPEIPPWRGRDRHRQSRRARLVGSAERPQGRHLHPCPASRTRPDVSRTRAACCAISWGSRRRFPRCSGRDGRERPAPRSPNAGSDVRSCRADRRRGAISPNSADCRSLSSWPRAPPTPFAKVRAAAPGSRTVTTLAC